MTAEEATQLEPELPSVWIVNAKGFDYTDAESYGSLRALTKGFVRPIPKEMLSVLTEAISTQTKPEDFLCPSGFMILNILAALIWMEQHGVVRLLLWDRKLASDNQKNDYYVEEVSRKQVSTLLSLSSVV